jgi:hypothetical protein
LSGTVRCVANAKLEARFAGSLSLGMARFLRVPTTLFGGSAVDLN